MNSDLPNGFPSNKFTTFYTGFTIPILHTIIKGWCTVKLGHKTSSRSQYDDRTQQHIVRNIVNNHVTRRHITDDHVQSPENIEFNGLTAFYSNNVSNLKFGHLNINSIRHKFPPLAEALNKHDLGIVMLQETKIDESFPMGQFSVEGYNVYRNDYTEHIGGLWCLSSMTYLNVVVMTSRNMNANREE